MLRCKYFKSDFDVILDIGGIPDLEVDNWFAYDFRAIIYCRNDSTNRIIASNKDGKATNCINENGKIHIIAHKHGFAAGTVMCEFFAHIPDEKYPHGYRIEAKPFPIIELTNNAGDDVSTVSISTTIAVVSVNAYQQAVKQGFTGTQEEYYAGLGMLPDLATLTSDLRQGKREIAAALTAQGVPTQADAPMAEMAEGVRSLYAVPDVDAGSRDRAIHAGAYSHYDMVNEVNRHRRADYPYVCGCSFLGREVTLAGADATLLSDGTWIVGAEETSHVFDDGMSAHYAIFYFKQDFYSFPWPQGVTIVDIAALDSHPCFSASSAKPFVSLFVDAEPADYDGHDISFGNCAGDVVYGGVLSLPVGSPVAAKAPLRRLSMPDLVSITGNIVSDCTSLTILELPRLTALDASTWREWGFVRGATKNLKIYLPSLETVKGYGWNPLCQGNASEIHVPKLKALTNGIGFIHPDSPPDIDIYAASLVLGNDILHYVDNGSVRLHFGSQSGAVIGCSSVGLTALTIEPGFTGSIDFKRADLTADNLRELLVNLGDNTDGTTYRIQMGAANMAKLTEDEIAVATAKNYTVS